MLEAMRKGANNIFVKILLGGLALSFVAWGIGDVFRGRTSNLVATIGDSGISYNEYSRALQRELSRYQQILGQPLTEEQMEQFNIKRSILNQLIDNKLIRMRVDDLGVKVGNAVAKEQILSNNLFYNEKGEFDANIFEMVLKSNGLNKDDYVAALKEDSAVRVFMDTIVAEPVSVDVVADILYGYRNEHRLADLVVVPVGYIKEAPEPSETDLVQYYQDNSQKFAVPELREATYLLLSIENIYGDLSISEEELRERYESNAESYVEPEMRDVDQYLFDSQSDAQKALEAMNKGKASVYSDKKSVLGEVSLGSLPEDIERVVFEIDEGQYSEPVETDIGWHVFVVNKLSPSRAKSFDEVRSALEKEMKENRAADAFYEYANQIEDEFAAGATMEEVAKKFDLVVHKVSSLDKSGKGASGKDVANLPEPNLFIPLVFGTEHGEISPMTLLSDNSNYLVVRVDGIKSQRVKALDEVKGTAINLWKEEYKAKKMAEFANEIAGKIRNDGNIRKIADSNELKFEAGQEVKRPGDDLSLGGEKFPASVARELFSLNVGGVTNAYLADDGSFVVAQLKEVKPAEVGKSRLVSLRKALKRDFTDDVLSQYNLFLRKEYPIEVNDRLLEEG